MQSKAQIGLALNNSFKLLNALIIGATIYFAAAIVSRALGTQIPSFFGVPVSQGYAIFILVMCTVLHIGILRYIVHYARSAWINLNREERQTLYFELTGSNHLLTQGAERLRDAIINKDGFLFVHVDKNDPPSLLHWGIFFVAVFAVIRYEFSFEFVLTFLVGMTLSMANWQIGSSWLVALADLGRQSDVSLYFDDIEKRGPRYFGIVSGPWHGMNNNIFQFAAISLLDAFLRALPISMVVFALWMAFEVTFWIFNK